MTSPQSKPGWARPLTVGSEVGAFWTALPEEQTRAVVSAVDDERLLRFLRRFPLSRLEFSANLPSPKWFGEYDPAVASIVVNPTRPASSYGHELYPEDLPSVSHTAHDLIGAMQISLFHEIGHHVAAQLGVQAVQAIKPALRNQAVYPIRQRAAFDSIEYFAETFAAYRFHGDALYHKDPNGYTLIESLLRIAGLI